MRKRLQRSRIGLGDLARRLGFELLEERQMLSVSIAVASRAAEPPISGAGESGHSGIVVSGNGRYVVFDSDAPNLIAGIDLASQESRNLFRFDRETGETVLVSVDAAGSGYADGDCIVLDISDDGNVVLFNSYATNLHQLDAANDMDIYARDILAGTTQLVNVNSAGTGKVSAYAGGGSLSADGTLVVFQSDSNELVPLDQDSQYDVFVGNLSTGIIDLVSVDSSGSGSANAFSGGGIISANGRVVVFHSDASNLDPLDSNEAGYRNDLYARDLWTGITQLVTVNASGTGGIDDSIYDESVSTDGTLISFTTYSGKLNVADHNNTSDVFVRNLATTTTNWISMEAGHGDDSVMSENGKLIVFRGASGLTAYDTESQSSTVLNTSGYFLAVSVSADGSIVAFETHENRPFESTSTLRVYVHNTASGMTEEVGVVGPGEEGTNLNKRIIDVSPDGAWLAFASDVKHIAEGDTNGMSNVFSYEVVSGQIQLLSKRVITESSATAAGWSTARAGAVSANGRYVVFTSDAQNLVVGMDIAPGVRNVYRYDRLTGQVVLVSVNATGDGSGNGDSGDLGPGTSETEFGHPVISADGRVVAFSSKASNLHPMDNNAGGVFARNIETGTTYLVSMNMSGTGSTIGGAYGPQISADGNRVLFFSNGNDLQPIPVHRFNLFLRDLTTEMTLLVSVNTTGSEGANKDVEEQQAIISADGNVVAFSSRATNLHPLHTVESGYNIFVRNLHTGVTQLATLNSAGTDGANGYSFSPALSSDGTVVAFLSGAKNLHPLKTTGGSYDAFVRNLLTGELQLVSINTTATGGANDTVDRLSISADGRIVVFDTTASNISTSDVDNYSDVFARDLAGETTILVSDDMSAPGQIGYWNARSSLSADGSVVAFESGGAILALSLVTGDTTLVARGLNEVVDGASYSYRPSISADGTVVAFWSEAADLVPRDWNQRDDVFVAELTTDIPVLRGDYNRDGIVNAADYSVWRNTLGASGLTPYTGADGDGDGMVSAEDYGIWKLHFGETVPTEEASGEASVAAQVQEDTAGQASNGTQSVAAPLDDVTASFGASAVTSNGAAGASPSRVRVASVVRDSARDDALVAWLSALRDRADNGLIDHHRLVGDGLRECVETVFELVGSGI